MTTGNEIYNALCVFADEVTAASVGTAAGEPEEQLRAPFVKLLTAAGAALGRSIVCIGEVRLRHRLGKPDYGVAEGSLLLGYAELKAPGKGVARDGIRFTDHDRNQFDRFAELPNVLYSDGNQWAVYRYGRQDGPTVTLPGLMERDGRAAVSAPAAAELWRPLVNFLQWRPVIPVNRQGGLDMSEFAGQLAALCRFLRDDVTESLNDRDSAMNRIASGWRHLLFPDASDEQFADAYAQTVIFALLLARSLGAGRARAGDDGDTMSLDDAQRSLLGPHSLLSSALAALTDPAARDEIAPAINMALRLIGAVPVTALGPDTDLSLYFYEDFLAEYDPELRRDAGVYYTPVPVVRAQVRLIDDLLLNKLGRPQGFAAPDVETLDPAIGNGTYLLGIIEHTLQRVAARQGSGAVAGQASQLARNLYGFEIMVGPYAVTEMRLANALQSYGATLPGGGVQVYLTDTLESPNSTPMQGFFGPALALSQEHEQALAVKKDVNVLVCLGNPPYDRHRADGGGGWVRQGDAGTDDRPILRDFREPARAAGHGVHLKNLYNLYVYFWRWALWKVFEQDNTAGPGVVSFISASSYLDGKAFAGMREHIRRICDEVWILDLGGEGRGPRKSENIFNIQTPVAIAIAYRKGENAGAEPAAVHYVCLRGARAEKLAALDEITDFEQVNWQRCPDDWQAPFRPAGEGIYFDWPLVTDLMPWQHSGVQLKRTWPIGADADTLRRRWRGLLTADDRAQALRESEDRKIERGYNIELLGYSNPEPIGELASDVAIPPVRQYAYRFLDRQHIIADGRLISRPRPSLWGAYGGRQVYLMGRLTKLLGRGPGLIASALLPDLDHFGGGGKDVIPLYRDAAAAEPNILPGLLDLLSDAYGQPVTPEDFAAYLYGIMAHSAYTERYYDELETREVRVPLTRDAVLFEQAVAVGRRLLHLHTYGQRYVPAGQPAGRTPQGKASCLVGVPGEADNYPQSFQYDADTETLHVGAGQFAPVAPAVYDYAVSGLKVVQSWLKYRMRHGAGRKSSPLDDIRPEVWPAQFTTELLELLWAVEATLETYPAQADLLELVAAGECFAAAELPAVPAGMRRPPEPPAAGERLIPV